MPHDLGAVRNMLKNAAADLLARRNVVATGVGYKVAQGSRTEELCVVCSVTRKLSVAQLASRDVVPASIDGIPTDVVQTGRIRALQPPTGRHRPAPGGISIGHGSITAGTLGCLVKKDGMLVVLSNNHVLANTNDAEAGDPILQPGPIDGGRFPDDHIADLTEFVPINFREPEPPSRCPTARAVIAALNMLCRAIGSNTRYQVVTLDTEDNLVDAAIATPLETTMVADEILDIGIIQGVAEADLGSAVKKSGRTTGLTTGEILQVDVTSDVDYGGGRTARFRDQLLAGPMSQGGDSGSAVLDDGDNLVGLLFAGSDNTTIINRISHVFSALGVRR